MLEDLATWAFTTPFGITVAGGVLVVIVCAVAATVSRGFRVVLGKLWQVLTRVRLTTSPQPGRFPLPPARWVLRPTSSEGSWIIANFGAGNASAVQIDSVDGSSMILDDGFWKRFPAHHAAGVRLSPGHSGFDDESTWRITWRDDRKASWAVNIETFPNDRYQDLSRIKPIPRGQIVPFSD